MGSEGVREKVGSERVDEKIGISLEVGEKSEIGGSLGSKGGKEGSKGIKRGKWSQMEKRRKAN